MTRILLLTIVSCLTLLTAGCQNSFPSSPHNAYLDILNQGLRNCRRQIPYISISAQQAAQHITDGRQLWIAGTQPDFVPEAMGRAGGLIGLKSIAPENHGQIDPRGKTLPAPGDVVLFGCSGNQPGEEKRLINLWKNAGIYVVAFGGPGPSSDYAFTLPVEPEGLNISYQDQPALLPTDTVLNLVNLWCWTGEFTAACTRLNRMPTFYKSYFLPGGRERGEKYAGTFFHPDLTVPPIPPADLATRYLDNISSCITRIHHQQHDILRRTARWWRSAAPDNAHVLLVGHIFPTHVLDERAPSLASAKATWHDHTVSDNFNADNFVLYLGYQTAPDKIIQQARNQSFPLTYATVTPAADQTPADNILYLDPCWPYADACVSLDHYDADILPASGVVTAAIYWAILAETLNP